MPETLVTQHFRIATLNNAGEESQRHVWDRTVMWFYTASIRIWRKASRMDETASWPIVLPWQTERTLHYIMIGRTLHNWNIPNDYIYFYWFQPFYVLSLLFAIFWSWYRFFYDERTFFSVNCRVQSRRRYLRLLFFLGLMALAGTYLIKILFVICFYVSTLLQKVKRWSRIIEY